VTMPRLSETGTRGGRLCTERTIKPGGQYGEILVAVSRQTLNCKSKGMRLEDWGWVSHREQLKCDPAGRQERAAGK
jgi:hypothetical protein